MTKRFPILFAMLTSVGFVSQPADAQFFAESAVQAIRSESRPTELGQFQIRVKLLEISPDIERQVESIIEESQDTGALPIPGEVRRAGNQMYVVGAPALAQLDELFSRDQAVTVLAEPVVVTTAGRPAKFSIQPQPGAASEVLAECTVNEIAEERLSLVFTLHQTVTTQDGEQQLARDESQHQFQVALNKGMKFLLALNRERDQKVEEARRQYVVVDVEKMARRLSTGDLADDTVARTELDPESVQQNSDLTNQLIPSVQNLDKTPSRMTRAEGHQSEKFQDGNEPTELDRILKKLFPDAMLEVTPLQNSIFMRGFAANAEEIDQIEAVAEDFYPKVHNFIKVNPMPTTQPSQPAIQALPAGPLMILTLSFRDDDVIAAGLHEGSLVDIHTFPLSMQDENGVPQVRGNFKSLTIHSLQNRTSRMSVAVTPEQAATLRRIRETHRFEFRPGSNDMTQPAPPTYYTAPDVSANPYSQNVPHSNLDNPLQAPRSPSQIPQLPQSANPHLQPPVQPSPAKPAEPHYGPPMQPQPNVPSSDPEPYSTPRYAPQPARVAPPVPVNPSTGEVRDEIKALRKDVQRLIDILQQRAAANPPKAEMVPAPVMPGEWVFFFNADWCLPCKTMLPLIEKLKGEGKKIRIVNVDAEIGLAEKFKVTELPTLIRLKDGELIPGHIHRGLMSEAMLRDFVGGPQNANRESTPDDFQPLTSVTGLNDEPVPLEPPSIGSPSEPVPYESTSAFSAPEERDPVGF